MITTAGWGILFRLAGLWPRATGRWWWLLQPARGVYPRVGTKAQAAYRVFFRQYPQFRDALLSRPDRYRAQVTLLNRLEAQGRAFLIRPLEPELPHLEKNPELAASYYRHGYTRMAALWPELQAFLNGK